MDISMDIHIHGKPVYLGLWHATLIKPTIEQHLLMTCSTEYKNYGINLAS